MITKKLSGLDGLKDHNTREGSLVSIPLKPCSACPLLTEAVRLKEDSGSGPGMKVTKGLNTFRSPG